MAEIDNGPVCRVAVHIELLRIRTASQIEDVPDADLWAMDCETQYFDEGKALTDNALYRVRGVSGVRWAVPLYKGIARVLAPDGGILCAARATLTNDAHAKRGDALMPTTYPAGSHTTLYNNVIFVSSRTRGHPKSTA